MTISVIEAGRRLGISKNTAYKLAREGVLPGVRAIPGLDHRYVVYEPALMSWLEGRNVPTTTGA